LRLLLCLAVLVFGLSVRLSLLAEQLADFLELVVTQLLDKIDDFLSLIFLMSRLSQSRVDNFLSFSGIWQRRVLRFARIRALDRQPRVLR